jgi:hypothetical protein
LVDFGYLGAIASAIAEVINRGLGLEGRKAFILFLLVVALVVGIEVAQDLWSWAQILWNWFQHLSIAVLAGTGAHKLIMSRKDFFGGKDDGTSVPS